MKPKVLFGDVKEEQVLEMVEGLPGFEGIKRYALIDEPAKSPFRWLPPVS